jgi:Nitric oxide reductase large subunit
MVHARLAMPMAYGVPTMLIWVVAFLLAGAATERRLSRLRIAVVVMAVGFYLQVLLSLMLLMTNQFKHTATGVLSLRRSSRPAALPRVGQGPTCSSMSGSG